MASPNYVTPGKKLVKISESPATWIEVSNKLTDKQVQKKVEEYIKKHNQYLPKIKIFKNKKKTNRASNNTSGAPNVTYYHVPNNGPGVVGGY